MRQWKKVTYGKYTRYFMEGYTDNYFTPKEAEVLCLLHGRTYREISSKLNLSVRTIEAYSKNMCNKFLCRSKRELINQIPKSEINTLKALINE